MADVRMNCPTCDGILSRVPNSENRVGCTVCDTSWDEENFQLRYPEKCAYAVETKKMKVPCSYPKCGCFKTIDPTEAMHDEPMFWFCKVHEGTHYMRCGKTDCDKIKIMGEDSGQAGPPQWYCINHAIEREEPLKPGEHPQTMLSCAFPGCGQTHSFDVAEQIPDKWVCPEHVSSTEHDYKLLKILEDRLVELEGEIADNKTLTFITKEEYCNRAFNEITRLMAFDDMNEVNLRAVLFTLAANVEKLTKCTD